MTVSVLGTEYDITICLREADEKLDDMDGYTDWTTHRIVVCDIKPDKNSVADMESYMRKVMRHEIVHAFFMESGLQENSGSTDCYGLDETITDWIAIQGPKIYKAWESVGAV